MLRLLAEGMPALGAGYSSFANASLQPQPRLALRTFEILVLPAVLQSHDCLAVFYFSVDHPHGIAPVFFSSFRNVPRKHSE